MRICYDNLDKLCLTSKGNFRTNGGAYIEKNSCLNCGEPYLSLRSKNEKFCSVACSNSYRNIGKNTRKKMSKNNGNLKGHVTKLALPLFETFKERLILYERIKPIIDKEKRILLQVTCSKCKKWFTPNISSVYRRIYSLCGKITGENRFYCSQKCKDSCEVYNKQSSAYINNNDKPYNVKELIVWSNEVLKRAKHKCEICNSYAEHAHHIRPKKLEPGLALDPENGVALCKNCHYKYGHVDECSADKLSSIICK